MKILGSAGVVTSHYVVILLSILTYKIMKLDFILARIPDGRGHYVIDVVPIVTIRWR